MFAANDINITGFILYACNNYGFNVELAKKTIAQFGGEEAFKQSAEIGANGGLTKGIDGWKHFEETIAFYNDNIQQIKEWLTKSHGEFEYDCSIPEYVQSMELMRGQLFELIEIQAFLALNDNTQNRYTHFTTAISYQVATDLCKAYQRFLTAREAA